VDDVVEELPELECRFNPLDGSFRGNGVIYNKEGSLTFPDGTTLR
jgi:alpha-glucuronidase